MQEKIRKKCDEIRDLLIEKNIAYGNSVFDKGLLFEVDPMYAIQARINDKLNRIKSKETYMSDNDLMDVTGYLILLQVYKEHKDEHKIDILSQINKDFGIDKEPNNGKERT
tara:strand:- start:1570 stop:1902 length:333 start_codon:yes stop_codon:yes gene_type:complete